MPTKERSNSIPAAGTPPEILDFYAQPDAMTSAGDYAVLLERLPDDVGALARIVQGLALHEYMADGYGVSIPERRKSESHLRPLGQMLERLLTLNPAPLSTARPPDQRLVGVCHHPMLLLVAMLRANGIPARGRCGFGAYFNPGFFEDHWICEYWNAAQARWLLVDAQFDEVWRQKLHVEHDVMDVPRDRFLVAGDAWAQWRAGRVDDAKFGIFVGDKRGAWFIAGNLVHDLAALNKMEMLPWDVWGAMPAPDKALDDDALAFFDRLAAITRVPDVSFAELRRLYQTDARVRVPATVFNALRNRQEPVETKTS